MNVFPNFKDMEYGPVNRHADVDAWEKAMREEGIEPLVWLTNEQISVKSLYTAKDLEGIGHLGFTAGQAPNLRGRGRVLFVIWVPK